MQLTRRTYKPIDWDGNELEGEVEYYTRDAYFPNITHAVEVEERKKKATNPPKNDVYWWCIKELCIHSLDGEYPCPIEALKPGELHRRHNRTLTHVEWIG